MLVFPNAKINLFLSVEEKRADGFHNIRSVIYPVPLHDVVEFDTSDAFRLEVFGKTVPGDIHENLLYKAWFLLRRKYDVPPVKVALLKNIPLQSGLGGGSADATFFLKALNDFFALKLTKQELLELSASLGSDCPFFVENRPALVSGRGEIVKPVPLRLKGYYLLLVFPDMPLSTAGMYASVKPEKQEIDREAIILSKDFSLWRRLLKNDFEPLVPAELAVVKRQLYDAGALYASMTGSGSAFFGIFKEKPQWQGAFEWRMLLLD